MPVDAVPWSRETSAKAARMCQRSLISPPNEPSSQGNRLVRKSNQPVLVRFSYAPSTGSIPEPVPVYSPNQKQFGNRTSPLRALAPFIICSQQSQVDHALVLCSERMIYGASTPLANALILPLVASMHFLDTAWPHASTRSKRMHCLSASLIRQEPLV
jgi:hypothetical protein